ERGYSLIQRKRMAVLLWRDFNKANAVPDTPVPSYAQALNETVIAIARGKSPLPLASLRRCANFCKTARDTQFAQRTHALLLEVEREGRVAMDALASLILDALAAYEDSENLGELHLIALTASYIAE